MNNNGLYRGDTASAKRWQERQKVTVAGTTAEDSGLSALSLGYEANYQKIAEMSDGIGIVARTPYGLKQATEKGYKARVPVVVNVIVDTQSDLVMVSVFFLIALSLSVAMPRCILWDVILCPSQSAKCSHIAGLCMARHGPAVQKREQAVIHCEKSFIKLLSVKWHCRLDWGWNHWYGVVQLRASH